MTDDIANWMYRELTNHPERYERRDADGNIDHDLEALAIAAGRSPLAPVHTPQELLRLAGEVAAAAWEAGDL